MRLWLAYTVLTVIGMSALMFSSSLVIDTIAYRQLVTSDRVSAMAQDYGNLIGVVWADGHKADAKVLHAILARGVEELRVFPVDAEEAFKFNLSMISDVAVRLRLFDERGGVIAQEASAGAERFSDPTAGIRVTTEIYGQASPVRLETVFLAPYDIGRHAAAKLWWVADMWAVSLITSAIICLGCALLAAQYVTSRLRRINEVTARWEAGDFEAVIPPNGGCELESHAVRLNAMARELQTHLHLRQAVAVSDERGRIALDLHDTVKQKLFALSLQLAAVQARMSSIPSDVGLAGNVDEAATITREAQRDIVDIIDQLRPVEAGAGGLGTRLTEAVESYRRRFDVTIRLELAQGLSLDPVGEIDVTRILHEALTNALRHGGADRIEVDVTRSAETIRLTVSDNGTGFDPDIKKGGVGMASMRARATRLPDGAITVASRLGFGTMVILTWRERLHACRRTRFPCRSVSSSQMIMQSCAGA